MLTVIKYIVSVTIIVLLLLQIDFDSMSYFIQRDNILVLILASICLIFADLVIRSYRTYYLFNNKSLKFFYLLLINAVSGFWGAFFPSGIGADGIKLLYLKEELKSNWKKILKVIVIERVYGLSLFFMYISVFAALNYEKLLMYFGHLELKISNTAVVFMAGAIVVMLLLVIYKRSKMAGIGQYFNIFSLDTNLYQVAYIYIVTFVFQAFRVTCLYLLTNVYSSNISIFDVGFVLSITAVLSMLPISIGAIGVREGAISIGLILFGLNKEAAIAISIMFRIIITLETVIGGFLYVFFKKHIKPIKISVKGDKNKKKV